MGARRFGVIDNNSSDAIGAEIHRFATFHPDAKVVVQNDPELPHFQSRKMTAMAHHAMRQWPDVRWIVAVDAD